jgi:hypothetical protein
MVKGYHKTAGDAGPPLGSCLPSKRRARRDDDENFEGSCCACAVGCAGRIGLCTDERRAGPDDAKADKAQAKADKAERKAMRTKQQKKADKAQDKANREAAKAADLKQQ